MNTPATIPTANDRFIHHCLEFDALIEQLQDLRANHFNTDAENVNWGDVGSAEFVVKCLTSAISHHSPHGIHGTAVNNSGKTVKVFIPTN